MEINMIEQVYWHQNAMGTGDVFDNFFDQWAASLRDLLVKELSKINLSVSILGDSVFAGYKKSISETALRVLIREIEVSDISGEL